MGVQNRKHQVLRGKHPSSCATPATAYVLDVAIGHRSPTPPELLVVNETVTGDASTVNPASIADVLLRVGKQVSKCERVVASIVAIWTIQEPSSACCGGPSTTMTPLLS
ncbi:hypothetical protein FI667_g10293, partial [Globisporangium splendens]